MKTLCNQIKGLPVRVGYVLGMLALAALFGCGDTPPANPPPEPAETSASVSVRMVNTESADTATSDSFWGMVNEAEADQ